MLTTLDASTFQTKIFNFSAGEKQKTAGKPVVIKFFADWCPPCKVLAPVVEKTAKELGDQVDFYEVNIDSETVLPQHFGISSIPALIFIPIGKEPVMHMGALSEAALTEKIKSTLLA